MVELSEDNTTINKNENSQIINQKPLFTQEQRESLVKAFIEAWNIHKVSIDHSRFSPVVKNSLSHVLDEMQKTKTVANVISAKDLRNLIEDKIKIASGAVDATPEVIYKTINSLYSDIIEMQGRHYLTGTFLSNEIEDRIIAKVKKDVDQHIEKIRNELGLDDV